MNDEERAALAERLDKDLESFVESKIAESASKRRDEASATDNLTVDELYDVGFVTFFISSTSFIFL